MPSLDIPFLYSLRDDYKKYTCFIETGTNYGGTIFEMEPHFEKLHTIEFSETIYSPYVLASMFGNIEIMKYLENHFRFIN